MLLTEENMSKVIETMNELDDIVKHQEEYNADTKYARDARLSAFNKLMFDVFDRLKTDLVFLAAVEFENPQMMRSALDDFNYKLEAAENKRQTDKFGAYTENRLREITQDNIARFKKITEIDPDIAKLERVLNIQEGEAGRRQMDALESGFEEYNKYKREHPGDSKDFSAWVSAYKNEGGIIGQVVSTLLMNFPGLRKAIEKAAGEDTTTENTTSENTNAIGDYASGGIVPGDSYSGDKLTANVNSGEMILNKEQQANLWNLINGKEPGKDKKTSKWLDNATSKLSKQKNEEEKKPDPVLTMDVQNTVNQALAARAAPPQAAAPQAGAPKTNNGFGRTNLA
jgi:hypothetical protein